MVMTTATASWELLCIQAFPFAVPNGWSAETWMIFLTGWNSIKGLQTKPDQRRQAVVFGWRLPLLPLARETGTSWFEHRSNIRTAHHVYLQLPYIFCVQWRKNILISCSAFMNPLTILCPRILPPPFHVFVFFLVSSSCPYPALQTAAGTSSNSCTCAIDKTPCSNCSICTAVLPSLCLIASQLIYFYFCSWLAVSFFMNCKENRFFFFL